MTENKDMPAYPFMERNDDDRIAFIAPGLSKREYFAGLALQGILANHWCLNGNESDIRAISFQSTAVQAVKYADALLSELLTPQP